MTGLGDHMIKRKVSKKNKNQQTRYIGAAAVVVILFAAVMFLTSSTNSVTVNVGIVKERISPQDYQSSYISTDSDHILIDVRTAGEYSSGHIAGSVNIPVEELSQRLSEVPSDKDIVVYCRSGNRSAQASDILANNGFDDIYDLGGIIAWQQAGYMIE